MAFNWTRIAAANPLQRAMALYEAKFGHPVPSGEIKTAALSGTTKALIDKINSFIRDGKPNPRWAEIKDRLAHERAQN